MMSRRRCIAPGTVSPDDLLAYAKGRVLPGVEEHLDHCEACRLGAAEYAAAERATLDAFRRPSCPPSITIGEYVLGLLAEAEACAIEAHLHTCPSCAEEHRAFRSFLSEPNEPPL